MSDQLTPYGMQPTPQEGAAAMPPLAQTSPPLPPPPPGYGGWPAPLAPLPVQSLSYGYGPPGTGRPGILTAVAVLSIVLASLSLLAGLWGGLFSIGMYAVSQIRVPTAATTVSTTPARTVVSTTVESTSSVATGQQQPPQQELPVTLTVGPRGMEEPERRIVIGGLQQARGGMEPLSPARVKMLDALLADSGQDMFGFRGPALTYNNISSNVSDAGQLMSAAKNKPGADYFVIGSGRIELYDDHGLFNPSTPGTDVVRVSEEDLAVSVGGAGLAPKDVQAVINRIQTMSGQQLSPAHASALRSMLSSPSQGLITPRKPGGIAPDQQVTQVMLNSGNLNVMTTSGGLMLSPNGTVVNSWSMAGGGFGGPMAPPFRIPAAAALMTGLESLASLLLAVFLLVCGILTLRQNRWGRRGHLIYAALKIPLVIVAAIGWAWLFYSMSSTVTGGSANPQSSLVSMLQAGGYAAVGLIYPIALLIVFTRRKVREYYNPVGG
jgi:hypothetical protein